MEGIQSRLAEQLVEIPANSTGYLLNPSVEHIHAIATAVVPSVDISRGSYANLRGTVKMVADTRLGSLSEWDPLTILRLGSAGDVSAIELFQQQFNKGAHSFLLTPDSLTLLLTDSAVAVAPKSQCPSIFATAKRHASTVASNSTRKRIDISIDMVSDAPGEHFPLSTNDVRMAFDTAQAIRSEPNADVIDILILTAAYQRSPRRPVRRFIENASICSRRTFFRRYRSLHDNGWISTGRTRIGLGRPITQLLVGQRVQDAESVDDVHQEYIQSKSR
jgi:hypothetical protein